MANFEQERKIEAHQWEVRLREIKETIYTERQPIGSLKACVTGLGKGPERMPKTGWKPFEMFGRWGGFDQTTWFRMKVRIPKNMAGQKVVALIRPGGEALGYVNGVPAQGFDRNHDELVLTNKAKGGETFEIALEGVPSVRFDDYHNFEYADIAVKNPLPWDFYWDCKVVLEVLAEMEDNYAPARQLLDLVGRAVKTVDLSRKDDDAYLTSMKKAQGLLRTGLKDFAHSYGVGELTIMGQSHIDSAWLWPLRETHRKCGRTFSTVLSLLDQYPEFIFMASQAVQYDWLKQDFPELYKRIKQHAKKGQWEPMGAMWVESDCNVPSGEALIRQVLYGNRFFRKEFGIHSRTVWLPDAFGYTWAFPQILKKAQIDTFVTTKISWGRFTDFPYSLFQWEGADGTRIRGLMPPMNYNGMMSVPDAIKHWDLFKQKEKVQELPYAIGYGDGGGGPTMEMIERAKRLSNIVGVPKCTFSKFQDSVDRMAEQVPFEELPVWNGELYLEFHRGCQTSQARTKRHNRKCELLIRDAELLGSLALLHGGKYDQESLFEAWKLVLLNQFHDILPGSSITEVYQDTERDYGRARELAGGALDASVAHLASRIDTSGKGTPILVFNSLSWVRTDVVEVDIALPKGAFHVTDTTGETVPCQQTADGKLLIEAHDVPPLGYAVFRLMTGPAPDASEALLKASTKGMENEYLRVKFNAKGDLTSVYDKVEGREILAKGERGNMLQLFEDRPHGNDAWDIDHNFEEKMWEFEAPESITVLEEGPVRAVVRITRKNGKSTICQDVTLHAGSLRLDFVTKVDWWEKHVLLKASFPVDVRSSNATYEIQYATIDRATHHNTAFERGRFEVPAQRWADMSEGDYGISLLNDCKYGYDIHDNVMRLSLLRSPVEPDPKADEGEHEFVYSLYPHPWDWRSGVVQQGAELNAPLLGRAVPARKGGLPSAGAFASVDAENVIIDTVKRHEDSRALIVRCYEAYGQRGEAAITFGQTPKSVAECDLMEENDEPVKVKGASVKFYVKPYEIRTFKVTF